MAGTRIRGRGLTAAADRFLPPSARDRVGSAHPGVVVIGGDFVGLGVARGVGRAGVPVCVVDDERSITRFSRYTSSSLRVPDLRRDDRVVDALLEADRRFSLRGWVLMPTRDEIVAAISHNREILAEVFCVPIPAWDVVRWVWDKRNTYERASSLGIATPRTWLPSSVDDLARIDAPFPLAIKPAVKEHFIHATKAKAWRADTPMDLERLYQRAAALVPLGEVMVQELIPGDGRHQYAFCCLFREGRPAASMTVRRRRQHPPEFGKASTFVETISVPDLEHDATRFLQSIGYEGLAEVEFKYDERDGTYKLLDVNTRAWGYHALGPAAGVDFAALAYAQAVGRSVPPVRASPGVRWIRLLTDAPTSAREVVGGRLDLLPYLRSVFSADVEAVFSRRDPLPGLAELALVPYLIRKRGA